MPDYLWRYFDPDGVAIFVDPIPSVEPVIEPAPQARASTLRPTSRNTQPLGETPEHQAGRESRYKEDINIYFKRHTIYGDVRKVWDYYHAIQTKLQDKIQATVAKQKAVKL